MLAALVYRMKSPFLRDLHNSLQQLLCHLKRAAGANTDPGHLTCTCPNNQNLTGPQLPGF
ncbi:hypothetical protein D3C73_1269280 [compost metagenome]